MSQIAVNYAQALYDLAAEEQLEERILQELSVLEQSFAQEPAFVALLSAPNLSKQERCQILDESFRESVHIYVLNFLKILTEKGCVRRFADCCKAFTRLYHDAHGILPVKVVSAVALTELQRQKLEQKLCGITGKKILLDCRVDPSVLGGVRLDYDGKRVDGTVQSRLNAVRDLLKNTVL